MVLSFLSQVMSVSFHLGKMPPLLDSTAVHFHSKLYTPPNDKILMDVATISIHPGDVTADEYEEGLPDTTDNFV
jgi:hypothetical protein